MPKHGNNRIFLPDSEIKRIEEELLSDFPKSVTLMHKLEDCGYCDSFEHYQWRLRSSLLTHADWVESKVFLLLLILEEQER